MITSFTKENSFSFAKERRTFGNFNLLTSLAYKISVGILCLNSQDTPNFYLVVINQFI